MFGYLQIQKSELLVREFDSYKAVYCGLCRHIGKEYSFPARFGLSYDCTFYTMLLMAVNRSCSGFYDGRCACNPLKKCKFARCDGNSYSKASALWIISAYYKILDDLEDEAFFKRMLIRLIKPFFSGRRKKAAKKYPELDSLTADMMKAQSEAQQDGECSIDGAAHPTAVWLAKVFSLEAKNETDARVFYEFGYHIGRWIYLIDAADDVFKDRDSGNFNPFLKKDSEVCGKSHIAAVLNQSLARAYDAYNLIDITDFKGILDNMILLGFPSVQNKVLEKKFGGNNE